MAEVRFRRGRIVAWLAVLFLVTALFAACERREPVAFHAEGRPELLSAWRLFEASDGILVPNADVTPYDLNTPLFTDYAHKLRTVWMPRGAAATYDPAKHFDFPVGTILSKTFYYPRMDGDPAGSPRVRRGEDVGTMPGGRLALSRVRLIETRLLVRREDGWIALAYVWNDEQTEARLTRGGALIPLMLVGADAGHEPATYAVPDENQCAGCHAGDLTSQALHPLGPTARNLDRHAVFVDADGQALVENQLEHWSRAGRLLRLPESDEVPTLASWRDPDASLDARARAYLDVNCGHCHSPTGPGKTSGMWLGHDVVEPLRLGRCKLPIAAGQGTGDRRYGYVPGAPDASILTYRMESNDPGVMMPELGRSVVHREGVALIRAWIAAQDGECGVAP